MYHKKLEAENLFLSPVSQEDYKEFTKWMNDLEGTIYTNTISGIYDENAEKEYIDSKSGSYFFAIVDKSDGKLMGNVELFDLDLVNRCATMGIYIGDRKKRSRGYGYEAVNLILDFGFNILNLHSICLTVASFNERAKALYRKCGFKEVGLIRENRKLAGQYYGTMYMDILFNEYNSIYLKDEISKVIKVK